MTTFTETTQGVYSMDTPIVQKTFDGQVHYYFIDSPESKRLVISLGFTEINRKQMSSMKDFLDYVYRKGFSDASDLILNKKH